LAARYLPEFRLHANGRQLALFVWQIIARLGLFYLAGAVLFFVAMPWLLATQGLGQETDVARFYLLVLVLESIRGDIQGAILEPLLQQGQAQFSQVTRNIGFLFCLVFMANQSTVHLYHVVLAELAGSILGTASALHGLVRYLRAQRNLPGKNGWQPPKWPEMWVIARHMYFSSLINMTYGSSVLVIIIQRFIGLEASALFGFLLNLFGQICRFLPTTLLFSIIRPKLMASYISEGGMAQLGRNANLVGKLNLFVLMPLLIITWLNGSELMSLLSSGKFTQEYYLGAILLVLIPFSQRMILETVAVVSGQSHLCSWGSFLGVLSLPLAYWAIISGQALWGGIFGMFMGQSICNITIIAAMSFTSTYRPDIIGFLKLLAAALVAFTLSILTLMAWTGSWLQHVNDSVGLLENIRVIITQFLAKETESPIHGWLNLVITTALACCFFLLASYVFKPFRAEERMRLSRVLKNKLS
jgi:hypothetical protein